jgi:hypothetical protein
MAKYLYLKEGEKIPPDTVFRCRTNHRGKWEKSERVGSKLSRWDVIMFRYRVPIGKWDKP